MIAAHISSIPVSTNCLTWLQLVSPAFQWVQFASTADTSSIQVSTNCLNTRNLQQSSEYKLPQQRISPAFQWVQIASTDCIGCLSGHQYMWAMTAVGSVLWVHWSFPLLLHFSRWAKHGSHSSGFLRGIPLVTFWMVEVVWQLAAWNPICSVTGDGVTAKYPCCNFHNFHYVCFQCVEK